MANGPVSGQSIVITLPAKAMVFWSATAQATFMQYVAVWAISPSGGPDVLVFQATGTSPDGHSPANFGTGAFSTAAYGTTSFRVQVGVNGGASWQQVLWQETPLDLSGTTLFESFDFISEDGTDLDFNDTHLSLQWFSRLG
ncbi:hypothetical protein [Chthonobacter albigriseus]|uniref:hypothetical protein n=1 Tax=Chthonobacter albigriseus TaxID=1683161 RepID=UPI0015EECB91|nr:hypothetical protein [Chthonobacter albigriseus]